MRGGWTKDNEQRKSLKWENVKKTRRDETRKRGADLRTYGVPRHRLSLSPAGCSNAARTHSASKLSALLASGLPPLVQPQKRVGFGGGAVRGGRNC